MELSVIYMAAGNSRRFGTNKLLYPLQGKPMYQHGLERLLAAARRHPGWRIFVVSQYEEILKEMEKRLSGILYPVFSPESSRGISYTIRAGLTFAEQTAPESAGYAFFTADQPYLSEATMERFLEAMERAEEERARYPLLGSLCFGAVPGNPTYFSRAYLPELLALEGDTGGRRILRKYPERVRYVEADKKQELWDIDTAEEVR